MNKHKLFFVITLFIFICLVAGCQYFELLSNKEWRHKTNNDEVEVYISGDIDLISGGSNDNQASYWQIDKDAPIKLENGYPGKGYDMYCYHNNIYIAGCYNGEYVSGAEQACYWKNGKIIPLETAALNSMALDICAVEENVYVSGYMDFDGTIGLDPRACYWKNGKLKVLSNIESNTYKIIVIKDEVCPETIYVSGWYRDGEGDIHACYWENDKLISLQDNGNDESTANAMAYNNGNLYLVGRDDIDLASPATDFRACYWINNKKIDNLSTTTSGAFSIVINDGNIYIGGYENGNTPVYWKNFSKHYLPTLATLANSKIVDMYVFNGDLYIAGVSSDGTDLHATLWKNDNFIKFLVDYDFELSSTKGIIVKYKNF